MARPSATIVTINKFKFPVLSASVSFSTASDRVGMPMMGSFVPAIEISVDLREFHDDGIMKFEKLKFLFDLAKLATKDKITDIRIEFWPDEAAGLLGAGFGPAGALVFAGAVAPVNMNEVTSKFKSGLVPGPEAVAGYGGGPTVDAGNPICVYTLKGWISHWHTSSGNGANPILVMNIQPALDQNNYSNLEMTK